jgi:hypothetical protein
MKRISKFYIDSKDCKISISIYQSYNKKYLMCMFSMFDHDCIVIIDRGLYLHNIQNDKIEVNYGCKYYIWLYTMKDIKKLLMLFRYFAPDVKCNDYKVKQFFKEKGKAHND